MEIFSREFAYINDLVFIVCDFYCDKYIPENIYEVTDNISLFPVNNYPLIDYILQNLLEQNYKNIVLTGDKIESVIKHVMKGKFDLLMNICYFSNDTIFKQDTTYKYRMDNFGQFLKQLKHFNIQNNFLIIPGNVFSTFNLTFLKQFHEEKDATGVFLLFDTETNDPEFFKYDFSETGRLFGVMQNNTKKVSDKVRYNAPLFLYASPVLCDLFAEFSEASDILQLFEELKSTYSFGKFAFYCMTEDLLRKHKILKKRENGFIWDFLDASNSLGFDDGKGRNENLSRETILVKSDTYDSYANCDRYDTNLILIHKTNFYYSREITTLFDYINMCKDMIDFTDVLLSNTRLKHVTRNFEETKQKEYQEIKDQMAKHQRDNTFLVFNDASNVFLEIKATGEVFDCSSLNYDLFKEEHDSTEIDLQRESFFEECITYLKKMFKKPKVDIENVYKNITLFKITSNTTTEEVLEAFAVFFAEIVNDDIQQQTSVGGQETNADTSTLNNYNVAEIENIVCKAAAFFYLLANEFQGNIELQSYFMDSFIGVLEDEIVEALRFKVFYAYCYLLKSCKIIKKSVLKEFIQSMVEKEKDVGVNCY